MKRFEVKQIFTEVLLEYLNEEQNLSSKQEQDLYKKGVALGVSDKMKDINRKLNGSEIPLAFIRGYTKARNESWWNKFNDRMTDYLARIGSSRLR